MARLANETFAPELSQGRFNQIVYFVISLLSVLLLFRLIMRVAGASSQAGFNQFVFDVTAPFVAPFFWLFQTTPQLETRVFETETLLAAVVYVVVGYLLLLPRSIFTRQRP